MSPSFLIHTKNYILLGCRRVCCCVCSRSHGIHSTLCTVVHAKKNMALIICRYLLPFETREWKEEGTRKGLACQWLYIREKNSWIYTREGGWQQTRRTTPTFSWASCCLPANTWPIPIFSPSLLVFFFHIEILWKSASHIHQLAFNAPFIVVLGWLYYNLQSIRGYGTNTKCRNMRRRKIKRDITRIFLFF